MTNLSDNQASKKEKYGPKGGCLNPVTPLPLHMCLHAHTNHESNVLDSHFNFKESSEEKEVLISSFGSY